MNLKGKVCIITGTAGGMEKAIAESFHAQSTKPILFRGNFKYIK